MSPPQVTRRVDARLGRALAIAALTLPVMVFAHLSTAAHLPSPSALIAAAALVVGLVCLVGGPGRDGEPRSGRLLIAVALAQIGGQAAFSASAGGGCLPVVGRGAELGVRFALLRHDSACPQGTLAMTEAAATSASLAYAAALVLLVHVAAAGLGARTVLGTERALRSARIIASQAAARALSQVSTRLIGLGSALRGHTIRPESLLPRGSVATGPATAPRLFTQWLPISGVRRGPPALSV